MIQSSNDNWFISKEGRLPLLNSISWQMHLIDQVIPRMIPDLSETFPLCCVSDYSGKQKQSKFEVFSFLFLDPNELDDWFNSVQSIRKIGLGPFRTINYKSLNDGVKKQMLTPFLMAADSIHGILINFVIDKRLTEWKTTNYNTKHKKLLKAGIKRRTFEDTIKVTELFSLCLSGFVKEDSVVTWMTDDDVFTANKNTMQIRSQLVETFLDMYSQFKPIALNYESSSKNSLPDQQYANDLLAIPDLVAGSLSKIITDHHSKYGVPYLVNEGIPEQLEATFITTENSNHKSSDIFEWAAKKNDTLCKISIISYEAEGNNGIDTRFIVPHKEGAYCPI